MKATVVKTVEIEFTKLHLEVAVRYDEDDMPNDFPHRRGDMWAITIDLETGKIEDWPQGASHDLCMKVVDQGSYQLIGPDGRVVGESIEDYVPSGCGIGGGDYIEMEIEPDGRIKNWPSQLDVDDFFRID